MIFPADQGLPRKDPGQAVPVHRAAPQVPPKGLAAAVPMRIHSMDRESPVPPAAKGRQPSLREEAVPPKAVPQGEAVLRGAAVK